MLSKPADANFDYGSAKNRYWTCTVYSREEIYYISNNTGVLPFATMFFSYSFFADKIPEFMNLAMVGCVSQSFVVLLIAFFTIKKNFTLKLIDWGLNILSRFNLIKEPQEKWTFM